MKKICFISTSRADFGTLNELIKEVIKENFFSVQLIVSGSHTSQIFGKTEREVNKKNCLIKKIKVPSQNKNLKSVAESFSECVNKFSNTIYKLNPDIFVVFGDRYEMLAGTIAVVTAVLVVNVDMDPQWLPWILPTIILVPLISWWNWKIMK